MTIQGPTQDSSKQASHVARQFATFFVGEFFFGIEVLRVQEVLRYQETTPVPLAPEVIEGLINLRGQIVPAIDMRRRLRLKERPAGQFPMNMVVRSEDGPVSLLVDEIGDVVEAEEETFELPPDTLNHQSRALIRGVYKLNGRLMHVLDTERTLDLEREQQE